MADGMNRTNTTIYIFYKYFDILLLKTPYQKLKLSEVFTTPEQLLIITFCDLRKTT